MQGAYFGGYPFQNGGILTAEDLNAIVALALQEPSKLDPNAVIEAIPTGGITNDKIATPYVLIGSTSVPLGSAGVHTLAGLNDPVAAQDVATKRYVDTVAGALGYTAGIGLALTGTQFRLANTAVPPNTYGSATQVPRLTIDPQGRITAADLVSIVISAGALTDGTTGSGPVVLANNPTMGTINTQNVYVASNVVAPTIYVGQGVANGTLIVDGSNQATVAFQAAGATRFQMYRPPLSNDLRIWSAAVGDCMTFQYTTGRVGIGSNAITPTVPLAVGVNNTGFLGAIGQLQLLTNGAARFFAQDAACFTQGGVGLGAGAVPSSGMQFAVGFPNSGLNGASGQLSLLVSGIMRMAVYDNSIFANVALGIGAVPSGAIQLAVGVGNSGMIGSPGYLNFYSGGAQRLSVNDSAVYTTGTSFGVGAVPTGPQLAIGAGTTGFTGDGGNIYLLISAVTKITFSDTQVIYNIPVGIGTGPGSYSLNVVGLAGKPGGGSWSDSSDARLKENISYEFDALDKIRQLKPSLFDWRDGQTGGGGFIAQDVEAVFPEFVSRDADGDLALTLPFKFDAYLVRAIQQLEARLAKIEGTA